MKWVTVWHKGRPIDAMLLNDYTLEEMRQSLIDHDGYSPEIEVALTQPSDFDQMAPGHQTRHLRGGW